MIHDIYFKPFSKLFEATNKNSQLDQVMKLPENLFWQIWDIVAFNESKHEQRAVSSYESLAAHCIYLKGGISCKQVK